MYINNRINVGLLLKNYFVIFFFIFPFQRSKKVLFPSCDIIYGLQSEELCFLLYSSNRNCLHNGRMETGHSYSHIQSFISSSISLLLYLFDSTFLMSRYFYMCDEMSTLCQHPTRKNKPKSKIEYPTRNALSHAIHYLRRNTL